MVIVAGGGLSGLSAAYYLTKKYANSNLKLLVLEASSRFGGWVKSEKKAEYLFEAGPRTIRPVGPGGINTLNLIEDLGLSNKIIPIKREHPAAKNRMIYANNNLNLLPSSLGGMLKVNPPFTKSLLVSVLMNDLNSKPLRDLDDDSMYNFVNRRFGTEIADYLISPMICGICAGDAKEISVKFLMKTIFEWEQKHGSVIKGALKNIFKDKKKSPVTPGKLASRAKYEGWNIYSLEGGLERLPLRLTEVLFKTGIKIFPENRIQQINFYKDNKRVSVKVKDDLAYSAEHLFSSLPAYELALLLRKEHPELSDKLQQIPFVDVGVVNLQYNANDIIKQDGFGFLVPPLEKLPILGVIFDSCCFPGQTGTVLTVMMGGKWFREHFGDNPTEDQLLKVATDQLKNTMGIQRSPDAYKVNILKKCIPQYTVGHYERVEKIRKYITKNKLPLSLCGSSFDGVGVNDVIMSSYKAVQESDIE